MDDPSRGIIEIIKEPPFKTMQLLISYEPFYPEVSVQGEKIREF